MFARADSLSNWGKPPGEPAQGVLIGLRPVQRPHSPFEICAPSGDSYIGGMLLSYIYWNVRPELLRLGPAFCFGGRGDLRSLTTRNTSSIGSLSKRGLLGSHFLRVTNCGDPVSSSASAAACTFGLKASPVIRRPLSSVPLPMAMSTVIVCGCDKVQAASF